MTKCFHLSFLPLESCHDRHGTTLQRATHPCDRFMPVATTGHQNGLFCLVTGSYYSRRWRTVILQASLSPFTQVFPRLLLGSYEVLAVVGEVRRKEASARCPRYVFRCASKHIRATPLFDPQQSASPSARYPATPEKGGIVATTVARWAVSDLRDCLSSDVRIDNG